MLHIIKKNPLHFVQKVSIYFWLEVSLMFSVEGIITSVTVLMCFGHEKLEVGAGAAHLMEFFCPCSVLGICVLLCFLFLLLFHFG